MNKNSFSDFYKTLVSESASQIHLGSSNIEARLLDHDQMSLSASVYEGGNFIPQSVRKCVGGKEPFEGWIPTRLVIEEQNYQVILTYTDSIQADPQIIKDLLEEFSWQAEEWRLYLEEHGRHDLIYVRSK